MWSKIYTLFEKLKPSFSTKRAKPLEEDEVQLMLNNLSKLEQKEKILDWASAKNSHLKIPVLYPNIQMYMKNIMHFNRQMRLNRPISHDRAVSTEEKICLSDFYIDQESGRYITPSSDGFALVSSVKEFVVLRNRIPEQFENTNDKNAHYRNFSNTQHLWDNLKSLSHSLEEL